MCGTREDYNGIPSKRVSLILSTSVSLWAEVGDDHEQQWEDGDHQSNVCDDLQSSSHTSRWGGWIEVLCKCGSREWNSRVHTKVIYFCTVLTNRTAKCAVGCLHWQVLSPSLLSTSVQSASDHSPNLAEGQARLSRFWQLINCNMGITLVIWDASQQQKWLCDPFNGNFCCTDPNNLANQT